MRINEATAEMNKDTHISHNSLVSRHTVDIEPLGEEAYQGVAGAIIKVIEPSSEADPAALLFQFLASFGNIIGLKPHFRVEDDIHSLKVNVVEVGKTAKARKGLSWGRVRRTFERVTPEWVKDHILSGLASGEGLISTVNSVTDSEGLGKRLFILETEFASALKIMSKPGNILSGIVRLAWDGSNLGNLSKNNPLYATNAHITINAHITEEELLRYLSETEQANGFGNRFLWPHVKRSKRLPDGGQVNEVALNPLIGRLDGAIKHAVAKVGEIKRDNEANEIWRGIYDELSEGKPGMVGALTARAEAYVMRLACIYALLDCSVCIRPDHLEAALAVWDYSEKCVTHMFGSKIGNPIADAILGALRVHSGGLDRTEINRLFKGHRSSEEISRALQLLFELRLARPETITTSGRSREVWVAIAK